MPCFVRAALIAAVCVGATLTDAFGSRHLCAYGGVFDCTVNLAITIEGSDPAEVSASGILVHHQGKNYLVTAYHNLHKATTCLARADLNRDDTGYVKLFDERSDAQEREFSQHTFGDFVYVDVARDLAIVEIRDPSSILRSEDEKDIGFLSLLPSGATVPVGGSGAAYALPAGHSGGYGLGIRSSVAYHCTISRHGNLGDLVSINDVLRTAYQTGSDRSLRDRIRDQTKFLVVETLSVTHGFSGTGLILSRDGFEKPENAKIAGVVIGGSAPGKYEGRYALVVSANEISAALQEMSALKAVDETKVETDVGRLVIRRATFPAAKDLPLPILNQSFSTDQYITLSPEVVARRARLPRGVDPMKGRHLVADGLELRDGRVRVCGLYIAPVTTGFRGSQLVFESCNFDQDCLDDLILIGATFKDCVFEGTQFRYCVLSGAYFDGACKFENGALANLERAWPHGVRHRQPAGPR